MKHNFTDRFLPFLTDPIYLLGVCDLVANLVVARNGWPHIAIAAIYGGSILNVLIGMVNRLRKMEREI